MKKMISTVALLALALGLAGCADQTADVQECVIAVSTSLIENEEIDIDATVWRHVNEDCEAAVSEGRWS